MYQTILFPTDFSEPAEEAWEHVTALAKAHGARIIVLYVAEPVMSHYGVVGLIPSVRELEEQHDVASRLKLQELEAQGKAAGIAVEGCVASGRPWQVIVKEATDRRADLVVLESHGRTGFSREAIGSTAERVVQQAPCSVLVVRPQKAAG